MNRYARVDAPRASVRVDGAEVRVTTGGKMRDYVSYAAERLEVRDDRTRVVEVRPTDARSLRAVVREARRTAARDLGAPTDDGGGGEDDAATAYVAVARGRAVGLCLVEPVPGAPRTMGVAAVWVLAARRRRGLGTALVDAARARFALAGPVPRRSIATTHRTRDGAAFFAAYGAGRVYAPTPGNMKQC